MANANCSGGFACDLLALSAAERVRHSEFLQRLRPAARDVRELRDGYRFDLDSARVSFLEAAEWVDFERRCCPFFVFELRIAGGDDGFVISVTGPEGAKAFLNSVLA
ncbi:MAG: hypothetical protein ABJF23_16465 [Bryobacteraceae bacterium]